MNVYLASKKSSFYVANLRKLAHLQLNGALNLNRFASNPVRPD